MLSVTSAAAIGTAPGATKPTGKGRDATGLAKTLRKPASNSQIRLSIRFIKTFYKTKRAPEGARRTTFRDEPRFAEI
jgi:hypothetical protein